MKNNLVKYYANLEIKVRKEIQQKLSDTFWEFSLWTLLYLFLISVGLGGIIFFIFNVVLFESNNFSLALKIILAIVLVALWMITLIGVHLQSYWNLEKIFQEQTFFEFQAPKRFKMWVVFPIISIILIFICVAKYVWHARQAFQATQQLQQK